MSHPDPRVNALMLADLGQKVINAIVTTQVMGHAHLASTLVYIQGDDPTVGLVSAVLRGDIEGATAALNRWSIEAAATAEAEVAAHVASLA